MKKVKGEWKVGVQWLDRKYVYFVLRLLDVNNIMHGGNFELYKPLGYIDDKDKAQRVADALNNGADRELDEAIDNDDLEGYLARQAAKETV